MTAGINPANVEGVLTEIGGKNISLCDYLPFDWRFLLVRSVENIVSIVKDGDVVVLDGATGEAYVILKILFWKITRLRKQHIWKRKRLCPSLSDRRHRLLTDMWLNWLPISAVRMRLQKLWSVTGKVWDYSVPSSYLWTATAYLPKKNSSKHIKQLQKLWRKTCYYPNSGYRRRQGTSLPRIRDRGKPVSWLPCSAFLPETS